MAVTFIGTLLLMAGVEPNPGPPDKVFSFRYQYLLIEVGTSILRKVFDYQVGPGDFKQYLDNDTAAKQQLLFLINRNKITAEQQKLIPPKDNSPSSSNFDITLLFCLLRNACGLRVYSHTVWINPSPTDTSIEAQIYRLKECRNKLMHSGSVFDSETDLNAKWVELCSILTDLGNFCRMANLKSLINEAETVDIDEKLKEQFDNMMSAWVEMDRLFDHGLGEVVSKVDQCVEGQERLEQKVDQCVEGQERLEQKVDQCVEGQERLEQKFETVVQEQQKRNTQSDNIEQAQKRQKLSDDDEVKKDIQQKLLTIYQRDCRLLQVSPFIEDDNEELICMYQRPTLQHTVYDEEQKKDKIVEISSYEEIFCQENKTYKRVYITGDAGVGKSSLCRRMCLLWSMSKLGNYAGNDKDTKKDMKFLEKFDFLFHVSLGATDSRDMIMMIVDQLFYTECEGERTEMYKLIKQILHQRNSLIVLDGFDEWTPKTSGKNDPKTPKGIESEKCVFLTMCRPYKLENVRLSGNDIDHQVEMTGIHGSSAEHYVMEVVKYMNKKTKDNKNPELFLQEIKKCRLYDHLCIPMVSSHLIVVWWFNQKLTHVSKAFLYGKILEMLFKRAERKVDFPSSTPCELKLPDCFSELDYIDKHVTLLQKVCLLSLNSLFKLDACASTLVFTKKQLMSSYSFTTDEMDFLCKVGIISKNKAIGCFEDPKQILSFVHKSYIEFFSALYVSSFDPHNRIDSIVKEWKSLDDVLQYENFFHFLAGLSSQKLKFVLGNMYTLLSEHLHLWRKNAIFNYLGHPNLYQNQLNLLQTIVINCFVECKRSNDKTVYLKLEDFIFDDKSDVDILRQLLLLNTTCVKSVYSVKGKYYDAFDEIKNLHCLCVSGLHVLSEDVVKFTKCMLNNLSTLHTVCIESGYSRILLPVLPVRELHQLTSLSLSLVAIPYDNLCDLVNFLSDNVHFEHIKLSGVSCDEHRYRPSDCTLTLNLHNHTQLTVLDLSHVNILCKNVNNSSLKSVTLDPASKRRIVGGYIDIFNCIKSSQLEHLDINGGYIIRSCGDFQTMRTLTAAVKTLPCMKSLTLSNVDGDVEGLELHPDATPVKIVLYNVTMSSQCFHCFIESCVNTKSVIKVELWRFFITTVDGESHRELSREESVKYMSEYLTSIQAVTITHNDDGTLLFETTSCQ